MDFRLSGSYGCRYSGLPGHYRTGRGRSVAPFGTDQEIARRFNYMYNTDVMTEPQAVLSKLNFARIDNRKMSKSYGNDISLNASTKEIQEKVAQMVTDPARIRKTDLGHPDVCTVHTYHTFYNEQEVSDICRDCTAGKIGCVACKKQLALKLDQFIAPIREKRAELAARPDLVDQILENGASKAREKAYQTMQMIRDAMKI